MKAKKGKSAKKKRRQAIRFGPCHPTGCGCDHEYDSGTITKEPSCTSAGEKTFVCKLCNKEMTAGVDMIAHDYKEEIIKEATFEIDGERAYVCRGCGDTHTEVIPKKERTVLVVVTDKRSLPKDKNAWRFSDRVEMTFDILNQTDKDIKGISGILCVNDLFGKSIININCDFTGKIIKAGELLTWTDLGMDCNQFMDNHMKFFNEKFEDLQFVYKISSVVYADGTTETY